MCVCVSVCVSVCLCVCLCVDCVCLCVCLCKMVGETEFVDLVYVSVCTAASTYTVYKYNICNIIINAYTPFRL